jgi:hypothetical protein
MPRPKKLGPVEIKAAIKALNEQDERGLGADLINDESTWFGCLFQKMRREIHQLGREIHQLERKNAKLKEVLDKVCDRADEEIRELMANLTRKDAEDIAADQKQEELELAGLSDTQIALKMNCTVSNVTHRRQRAGRKKLRPPKT